MEDKALTVTQLSKYIKQIFDAEEMLFNIKVIGEISGLSIVRGVAYFSLKDENATLSCVCFNTENFSFINGDNVVLTGTPKYYVKGGKLNFNVSKITKYGIGELYQRFLELKLKLEQKGYFDEQTKKLLPSNIKRVGVVSSKEGAVIQDIINVGTRRNPGIDIILYPVKVQGINAEYEIANGIKVLDNYNVDLIIIARGGGSLEDLQPFNTEVVADAIHNANKFIVSAVGHETDFTISDFCSDLRAPTPSAAAELVFSNVADLKNQFIKNTIRLKNAIESIFINKQQSYLTLLKELFKEYDTKILKYKNILNSIILRFINISKTYYKNKEHKFDLLVSKLNKLNPEEILKLGYATINKNNESINSITNLNIGDTIDIKLIDGNINAQIKNIKGD